MARLWALATILSGGLGLGLALGYLLLVAVSFTEGGDAITAFLVGADDTNLGLGFATVAVPYILLILHLWLRVNVGRILLRRGEVELAERFAKGRVRAGLLRAKKEATANRTVLIRVALRRGDYESAERWGQETPLPNRGVERVAHYRWRLEVALRLENLILANQLVDEAWPFAAKGEEASAFCACAGELAVRGGDKQTWLDWRERAEFAEQKGERLQIVSAMGAARFNAPAEECARFAAELGAPGRWLDDVPLAEGEITALRAALLEAAGDTQAAVTLRATEPRCDSRSEFVLRQ